MKRVHKKADGRYLLLYGTAGMEVAETPEPYAPKPHLRWHPLREEWVIYAPQRQERTSLLPNVQCPLCPSRRGGPPTEIPFTHFQVAVFENRFPALTASVSAPPQVPIPAREARGRCEVVVYTPEHTGSLATLNPEAKRLLVEVWIDRYLELYALEEVRFVMPFENRGEVVGVTLHHPHGQIYAYPFVPPVLEKEAQVFRKAPVILELLPSLGPYEVDREEGFLAFVPPFARYPFEVWVVPQRFHPGPWTFSEPERIAFARLLGRLVQRLDSLFDEPFPYVMVLHASPKGEEAHFHFHLEIYPPRRSRDQLKFLAGTELGAGSFVVDALPEETARMLRAVI